MSVLTSVRDIRSVAGYDGLGSRHDGASVYLNVRSLKIRRLNLPVRFRPNAAGRLLRRISAAEASLATF